MSINVELLETLICKNKEEPLDFSLHLQEKSYRLSNVFIANSPTPVTRPTTRGGVYFSEKYEYTINGIINDLSITSLLSKAMLGPNNEFADIQIRTSFYTDRVIKLNLHTNLTRSVQDKSEIKLYLTLVGLEII